MTDRDDVNGYLKSLMGGASNSDTEASGDDGNVDGSTPRRSNFTPTPQAEPGSGTEDRLRATGQGLANDATTAFNSVKDAVENVPKAIREGAKDVVKGFSAPDPLNYISHFGGNVAHGVGQAIGQLGIPEGASPTTLDLAEDTTRNLLRGVGEPVRAILNQGPVGSGFLTGAEDFLTGTVGPQVARQGTNLAAGILNLRAEPVMAASHGIAGLIAGPNNPDLERGLNTGANAILATLGIHDLATGGLAGKEAGSLAGDKASAVKDKAAKYVADRVRTDTEKALGIHEETNAAESEKRHPGVVTVNNAADHGALPDGAVYRTVGAKPDDVKVKGSAPETPTDETLKGTRLTYKRDSNEPVESVWAVEVKKCVDKHYFESEPSEQQLAKDLGDRGYKVHPGYAKGTIFGRTVSLLQLLGTNLLGPSAKKLTEDTTRGVLGWLGQNAESVEKSVRALKAGSVEEGGKPLTHEELVKHVQAAAEKHRAETMARDASERKLALDFAREGATEAGAQVDRLYTHHLSGLQSIIDSHPTGDSWVADWLTRAQTLEDGYNKWMHDLYYAPAYEMAGDHKRGLADFKAAISDPKNGINFDAPGTEQLKAFKQLVIDPHFSEGSTGSGVSPEDLRAVLNAVGPDFEPRTGRQKKDEISFEDLHDIKKQLRKLGQKNDLQTDSSKSPYSRLLQHINRALFEDIPPEWKSASAKLKEGDDKYGELSAQFRIQEANALNRQFLNTRIVPNPSVAVKLLTRDSTTAQRRTLLSWADQAIPRPKSGSARSDAPWYAHNHEDLRQRLGAEALKNALDGAVLPGGDGAASGVKHIDSDKLLSEIERLHKNGSLGDFFGGDKADSILADARSMSRIGGNTRIELPQDGPIEQALAQKRYADATLELALKSDLRGTAAKGIDEAAALLRRQRLSERNPYVNAAQREAKVQFDNAMLKANALVAGVSSALGKLPGHHVRAIGLAGAGKEAVERSLTHALSILEELGKSDWARDPFHGVPSEDAGRIASALIDNPKALSDVVAHFEKTNNTEALKVLGQHTAMEVFRPFFVNDPKDVRSPQDPYKAFDESKLRNIPEDIRKKLWPGVDGEIENLPKQLRTILGVQEKTAPQLEGGAFQKLNYIAMPHHWVGPHGVDFAKGFMHSRGLQRPVLEWIGNFLVDPNLGGKILTANWRWGTKASQARATDIFKKKTEKFVAQSLWYGALQGAENLTSQPPNVDALSPPAEQRHTSDNVNDYLRELMHSGER